MTKIVINKCFGGFGISDAAHTALGHEFTPDDNAYMSGGYWEPHARDLDRSDPELVRVVEELGADANDSYAALRVVEIPDDVEWRIHEYDGLEHVEEAHRTWS